MVIPAGTKKYRDVSRTMRNNEIGYVDRIFRNRNGEGYALAKVRVRQDRIPEIGDKFSSRHGQKGTVGMILQAEDMPQTAAGIIPAFSPNESYYKKIMKNKVAVFNNWDALCLFDTFTCIGSGQLSGYNYKAWDYTYFRIYLYRLFFKYNLYRYNSEIFEEKESAIKVRDQFEEFLNRYDISHVSFNFLGNEIYTKIGEALELEHELGKFRIRITNLSNTIQEERESKTNILLQIVTVLGGISRLECPRYSPKRPF
jgi:hypothetical protein